MQLGLGLRDAARGRVHKIPVLSNGTIFRLNEIATQLTVMNAYFNQHGETWSMQGRRENNTLIMEIQQPDIIEPEKNLQTTLILTPLRREELFQGDFLNEIFDTFESGYASNEISLTLSQGGKVTKLCRRGSEMSMLLSLEPTAISFQLNGYELDSNHFLETMCNFSKNTFFPPTEKTKRESSMKKNILFVLMPKEFQDLEFLDPHNALQAAGCNIDIASIGSGICVGSSGTTVTPTKLLSAMMLADFDKYDAIVIPGGQGSPTFLWNNEELQAVVRLFHEKGKLVATICYACIVPAQAGILQNRTATVYPTDIAKEIFADNQVLFSNKLCIDLEKEGIITAQSPQAIKLFINALLKHLAPSSIIEKEALNG
ncbi:DJ-1/PfpI family protein [Candidatus Dependentiae bacterium]|nr:DJ-1/PfpI family protein [Candidatus Dependentiae bacterium]